jgi:N-acetylglucosamine malate deacetylase 2
MPTNERMVLSIDSYRNFQSTPIYSCKALIAVVDLKLEALTSQGDMDPNLNNLLADARGWRENLKKSVENIETVPLLRQQSKEKIKDALNMPYQRLLSVLQILSSPVDHQKVVQSSREVVMPRTPAEFLQMLTERDIKFENDSEIAIVVPHQDDESIGAGAQISKMPKCLMVHVTDGAPEATSQEKSGGMTQAEYSHIRSREVEIALDAAGHLGDRKELGVKDQKTVFNMAAVTKQLVALFLKNKTKVAMTTAFEGGHPDHDALSFAIHAARALVKKQGIEIFVIEMPLYRMEGDASVRQSFIPDERSHEVNVELTKREAHLKSVLFDVHRSQYTLFNQEDQSARMSTEVELFRESPGYDFGTLPNKGNISRIYKESHVSAETWAQEIAKACKELGLESTSL